MRNSADHPRSSNDTADCQTASQVLSCHVSLYTTVSRWTFEAVRRPSSTGGLAARDALMCVCGSLARAGACTRAWAVACALADVLAPSGKSNPRHTAVAVHLIVRTLDALAGARVGYRSARRSLL